MTTVEPMTNTIYLCGLNAEDTHSIQEDFRAYPFPNWNLEVLEIGATPPANILSGQSIVVIGCGQNNPPEPVEAMWLVRILACGCPWVAVSANPDRTTREQSEAAGAGTYLARPFNPARLRELLWHNSVPQVGKTAVASLNFRRLFAFLAVICPDILLKYATDSGDVGFLAIRAGMPFHAMVLDGPIGATALQQVLSWGKGKVLGQPLPIDLKDNLIGTEEEVRLLLEPADHARGVSLPGGQEACEQIVRELPEVHTCVLIDLRSGQIAARATAESLEMDREWSFDAVGIDLLRFPFYAIGTQPDEVEPVEEVVILGPEAWCITIRIGEYALGVSADGRGHLGPARQILISAAASLASQSGIVVDANDHDSG